MWKKMFDMSNNTNSVREMFSYKVVNITPKTDFDENGLQPIRGYSDVKYRVYKLLYNFKRIRVESFETSILVLVLSYLVYLSVNTSGYNRFDEEI